MCRLGEFVGHHSRVRVEPSRRITETICSVIVVIRREPSIPFFFPHPASSSLRVEAPYIVPPVGDVVGVGFAPLITSLIDHPQVNRRPILGRAGNRLPSCECVRHRFPPVVCSAPKSYPADPARCCWCRRCGGRSRAGIACCRKLRSRSCAPFLAWHSPSACRLRTSIVQASLPPLSRPGFFMSQSMSVQ